MIDIKISKKFDSVILPFNVFHNLLTFEDISMSLNCIKEHMHDDSLLVIDMFNPNPLTIDNFGIETRTDFDVYVEKYDFNVRKITEQIGVDKLNQIISFNIIYQKHNQGNVFQSYSNTIAYKYFYPKQIKKIFEDSGFLVKSQYAYFDFTELKEDEFKKQIYVLVKE